MTVRGDRIMLPGKVVAVFGSALRAQVAGRPLLRDSLRQRAREVGGHAWPDGSLSFASEEQWQAWVTSVEAEGVTEEPVAV